ncbi:MAG: hypothetical protein JWO15_1702 [Sphingomonadales bacterium]|nr:hypothetical protein [Sphingomonadales bacterium]
MLRLSQISRFSPVALLASATFGHSPSMAADIVITSGTTDTTQKSVGGDATLTVQEDGRLSVADTAVKWNTASTDFRITNSGTIESIASGGRAINAGGSSTTRTITLFNDAKGVISSENDAFRINTDITGGRVQLINAGMIVSTVDGQALDFDAITSAANGDVEIDNLVGGVIQSTDADALRPGQGAVINNAGTIYAGAISNLSSDGVDLQNHSATIHNLAGGLISGARHGITTDYDVMVINEAGATIIGRNGSGVGSDRSGTIINYGTITGAFDGSGTGDGDGIDIDHVGYVENFGTIQALGAAGTHSDGRGNGSDGVTFGDGGIFINHAGALLYSVTTGAAFGVQATVINDGTIHAGGNAVATDVGNDVVINSGTIISDSGAAISLGSGNDQLTLLPGSTIIGNVDGSTGTDQITLTGTGGGSFAGAVNFEHLQVDSGNWTLTGSSIFTDGTTIATDGALTGSVETLTGAIDDAGTLTVDQPTDAVFTATLNGTGKFVKTGAGTLTIGDQVFTGTTQIAAGTLLVNGTLPSPIGVGDSATLGGTGTVGAVAVATGGMVAPGVGGTGTLTLGALNVALGGTIRSAVGSTATMAVTGDLVQQAGSTYIVGITPGQTRTLLVVSGTATIEQGAMISLATGTSTNAVGSRRTLLSAAGGVTGSYTVQQNATANTELRLILSAAEIEAIVVRTGGSLRNVAATSNQAAVAHPLAVLGVSSAAYAALTLIPSDDAVRGALSTLSGEIHASVRTAMTQDALLAEGAVQSRLDDLRGGRLGMWAQIVGGHSKDDGPDVADADRNTLGGMAGADLALGATAYAGIGAGYTRTRLTIGQVASHAEIGTAHLLGYAGTGRGPLQIGAAVGYAWNRVDTRRSVAFDGYSDQDRANYRGETLHAFGEISYVLSFRGGTIRPFVRGTVVHVHNDDFVENGGAAALGGAPRSDTIKFSDVGARFDISLVRSVRAGAGLAWRHAFEGIRSDALLGFAQGGLPFLVSGTSLSRNASSPTLNIDWQTAKGIRISAGYSGLFGAYSNQNIGRITVAAGF